MSNEQATWQAEFEAAGEARLRDFLAQTNIWSEVKKQAARRWLVDQEKKRATGR